MLALTDRGILKVWLARHVPVHIVNQKFTRHERFGYARTLGLMVRRSDEPWLYYSWTELEA